MKVEFYQKLNKYYVDRDDLFIQGKNRPTIENILTLILITFFYSLIIIISSFFYIEYLIALCVNIILLILIIINCIERKNKLKKLSFSIVELKKMRLASSPKFDHIKIDVEDYINDLISIGYNVLKDKKYFKDVYILRKDNLELKIISGFNFLSDNVTCYINNVKFNHIKDNDEELYKLIKNYKLNCFNKNGYEKLDSFYKFIVIKY